MGVPANRITNEEVELADGATSSTPGGLAKQTTTPQSPGSLLRPEFAEPRDSKPKLFPECLFEKLNLSACEQRRLQTFQCRTANELLSIVNALKPTFERWLGTVQTGRLVQELEESTHPSGKLSSRA
jgi:hypothetical protein